MKHGKEIANVNLTQRLKRLKMTLIDKGNAIINLPYLQRKSKIIIYKSICCIEKPSKKL